MNTLGHCYRVSFRECQPHPCDGCWLLRFLTTGAAVAFAFAWVPLSFAQSGKNIADLQLMGADSSHSTWMTIANVDGNFRLEAAQQAQPTITPRAEFSLKGGEMEVSLSALVSSIANMFTYPAFLAMTNGGKALPPCKRCCGPVRLSSLAAKGPSISHGYRISGAGYPA
jgi:hypothetical protein